MEETGRPLTRDEFATHIFSALRVCGRDAIVQSGMDLTDTTIDGRFDLIALSDELHRNLVVRTHRKSGV